jgi:hypothetical protein
VVHISILSLFPTPQARFAGVVRTQGQSTADVYLQVRRTLFVRAAGRRIWAWPWPVSHVKVTVPLDDEVVLCGWRKLRLEVAAMSDLAVALDRRPQHVPTAPNSVAVVVCALPVVPEPSFPFAASARTAPLTPNLRTPRPRILRSGQFHYPKPLIPSPHVPNA